MFIGRDLIGRIMKRVMRTSSGFMNRDSSNSKNSLFNLIEDPLYKPSKNLRAGSSTDDSDSGKRRFIIKKEKLFEKSVKCRPFHHSKAVNSTILDNGSLVGKIDNRTASLS
jgi:hypothetical protein